MSLAPKYIIILVIIALVVIIPIVLLFLAARFTGPPAGPGVQQGRLAACPATPNCVSTQSSDATHAMPPIPYSTSPAEAKARLLDIIGSMERATVITDRPDYLHVEFRSRVFRFVDDVEFFLDPEARLIHFRSAARLGQSDMGVNRARMQTISARFTAPAEEGPSAP